MPEGIIRNFLFKGFQKLLIGPPTQVGLRAKSMTNLAPEV